MKIKYFLSALLAAALLVNPADAEAKKKKSSTNKTTQTTTQPDTTSASSGSSTTGRGLGDILGAVSGAIGGTAGGILEGVLSTDKVSPDDLTGKWKYAAPAVAFKTDDLLKKAGGAAASTAIEEKLAGYYKTAGFDNMTLEVDKDHKFTMKLKRLSLKGEILEPTSTEGITNLVFAFRILGVNALKMDAYVTKLGSNQTKITFDISKLIKLIQTVGSLTGNASINSMASLLDQYDGLTAGFELKK